MIPTGNHIGTLIKPYGFKGELILRGEPHILNKLENGIALFVEISGQRIPFFVEEIEADSTGSKCIVKLEFINSDLEARSLVNCNVYSDMNTASGEPESSSGISGFNGFIVVDTVSGAEFTVTDFYDNPENPVLLLKMGRQEVMLPAKADYILSIDKKSKIIKAAFPNGLL